MSDDPIVEEVREARRQIFEECGNDLERLIERLKAAEVRHVSRLVTVQDVQQRAAPEKTLP
jgi:hypothetical protein